MEGQCVSLQKKAMITGASGSLEIPVRLAWILFWGVGVIGLAQLRDSENCSRLVASGKVSQVLVPRRQKGRRWDNTFRLVCEPLGRHAPEEPMKELSVCEGMPGDGIQVSVLSPVCPPFLFLT